jgi:lipoprotein-releasing system permease protein
LKKSDILLPKSFLQLGAITGSTGKFQYTQEGLSGTNSKTLHSTVTGFFDPGILPIGGKLVLAPIDLVKKLQREPQVGAFFSSTGYAIWSGKEQPEPIKAALQEALLKAGLSDYFHVETYKEYEFTKDLFLQLSSEKNLFRLLALIIIIVASSNITSLLLILVFTKKQEIAVLRAYGASKTQIGTIYTLAGSFIGLFGLIFGITFALITMHFLSSILSLLGAMQGHDVLSQAFYGTSVPTSISKSALLFVTVSTITISALSGAFAAISACRVNISQALKGE